MPLANGDAQYGHYTGQRDREFVEGQIKEMNRFSWERQRIPAFYRFLSLLSTKRGYPIEKSRARRGVVRSK